MSDVKEKKLNAMKVKILKAEKENLKTREKTNDQMIELIRNIIKNESKRNYEEARHAYKEIKDGKLPPVQRKNSH